MTAWWWRSLFYQSPLTPAPPEPTCGWRIALICFEFHLMRSHGAGSPVFSGVSTRLVMRHRLVERAALWKPLHPGERESKREYFSACLRRALTPLLRRHLGAVDSPSGSRHLRRLFGERRTPAGVKGRRQTLSHLARSGTQKSHTQRRDGAFHYLFIYLFIYVLPPHRERRVQEFDFSTC